MGEPPCFNLPVDQAVVYLGLGSNLGDRLQNLRTAAERIGQIIDVDRVSRVYESAAVGYTDQPDFLNLVLRAQTDLEPLALFAELKRIETALGRERSFRNAPRTIDIDVLAYDQRVLSTPELTIPHPRMLERSFVLLPLLEVEPAFQHPAADSKNGELARIAETLPRSEPRFSL